MFEGIFATRPLSFSKMHELVKYDILVDEELEDEDGAEMGLLN